MFDYQRVYSILFHCSTLYSIYNWIPSDPVDTVSKWFGAVRLNFDGSLSAPFSKLSGLLLNHDHNDPDKCHMNRSLAVNMLGKHIDMKTPKATGRAITMFELASWPFGGTSVSDTHTHT